MSLYEDDMDSSSELISQNNESNESVASLTGVQRDGNEGQPGTKLQNYNLGVGDKSPKIFSRKMKGNLRFLF